MGWLAVCQKQKDVTLDVIRTGHQPENTSLLSTAMMENMGRELIELCDQMEPYGLVDYQMGIWEEEILSGKDSIFRKTRSSHCVCRLLMRCTFYSLDPMP